MTGLLTSKEVGRKVVEDLTKSWKWILIALLISSIISLLFVLLLRFTAALLLWIIILSVLMLLTAGMWFCGSRWSELSSRPGSELSVMEVGLQTNVEVYLHLRQTWVCLLVILVVMETVLVVMLIFLRRRVRIAMALLTEASRVVGHMMSTLFFPIFTFILLSVCISCWSLSALFLSTSEHFHNLTLPDGNCSVNNSTCTPQSCGGSGCNSSSSWSLTSFIQRYLVLLQVSNVLLLCWSCSFSLALQDITLSGSFSSFYWTHKKPPDVATYALLRSLHTALRFHCGSLAFGALIISVVQLLRILLEFMEQKLRGVNNGLSRFLLCCLRCCFVCLEKFIRYVNRNAFIMMAIYGKNFCTSARDAFYLLMRNVLRVAVVDRLTDALLFMAKVLISAGVGSLIFFFFSNKLPVDQDQVPILHYPWLPLLMATSGSFLVAHCFFSVYSTCVDTLFLCLCDDLEQNDGSSQKPYFMSSELHGILGKSQKRLQ
ncbi:choline transporter-like protein 5-A isoform X1 [Gouania willdenowi]|uniref:choline transporter-like protein 5-A isoform X1 n=1 Tax=Gouania willdenowi TaxID=441366 RepID=UPI001054F357|nr:choline transporter-like protein 5-A isoform X1 [Gouania willdenowi]